MQPIIDREKKRKQAQKPPVVEQPPPEPEKPPGAKEVIAADLISSLKGGGWQKQINRMPNGKYEVEVYWVSWHVEKGRPERWSKIFDSEQEAQQVYSKLESIKAVKKLLPAEPTIMADTMLEIPPELLERRYGELDELIRRVMDGKRRHY